MDCVKRLLFILLFIPFLTAYADGTDRSEDREQLKKTLFSIEDSLNKLQMKRLLSHFDEHAILSFMTTEVANGKAGILAYYEQMFNLPNAPLKSFQTKASLDGPAQFHGNTIVASGRTQDHFELADGRKYQFNTRWLASAVKKQGEWKVVSLNFSVDPFENVVLDEVEGKIYNYALLAFFAGLVIMFLITRMINPNAKGD